MTRAGEHGIAFAFLLAGVLFSLALIRHLAHLDECSPEDRGRLRGTITNLDVCDGERWRPYRVPVMAP